MAVKPGITGNRSAVIDTTENGNDEERGNEPWTSIKDDNSASGKGYLNTF